jgi:lipoprotein-releasing system permease protein
MKQTKLVYFLATRLIFSKNNSYVIKVVSWVCLVAIMVGCMSLALIFAIMQGFQSTTSQRLQNIYPQVIIQAPNRQSLNWEKIEKHLKTKSVILACTPYAITYGVIHNPKLDLELDLQNLTLIKAINPNQEAYITNLDQKINSHLKLPDLLQNHQIILGEKLAQNLGLKINDQLEIFLPSELNSRKKSLNFKKIKAILSATLQTGILELDESMAICDLNFASQHFDHFGIHQVGLKLTPACDPQIIIQQLKTDLKLPIITWQELYEPIMAALKLEKYTGIAIACLIVLIASMTLIALLFMLITKHTSTIITLEILGLNRSKIRQVFMLISLIITSLASLCGLLLAGIIGFLIQKYQFIKLPEAYLLTNLPIEISKTIFITVFIMTTLISLMASILPLHLLSKIKLNHLLKTA